MNKILEKRQLSETVYYMKFEAADIAKNRKAGQFLIVQYDDEMGERIPLTIADANAEEGWVAIVFQAVGAGTMKISRLNPGDYLAAVLGPLGTPSKIEKYDAPVLCVGGGIGTAPLYPIVQALKADGINISGITMWGVIDTYSWLNDQATVGGGTDGTQAQCPLLFDGDYQAKPAFWGFVDPTKLDPDTKKVTVIEYQDDTFAFGNTYEVTSENASYTFVPMWTADGLKVKVTVVDGTEDATDAIEVYYDFDNSKSEAFEAKSVVVKRADAEATADGYTAIVDVPMELFASLTIGFDVRVIDGNNILSFNDTKDTQETSSKFYAEALMKPYTTIHRGTITVDAELDDAWANAQDVPLYIVVGEVEVSCNMKLLWDNQCLYVYATVIDPDLNKVNSEVHQQDSIEVFIDENNHKAEAYEEDDKQYRINFKNERSYNGSKCVRDNIESAAKKTDNGYVVEAMFKWTDVRPSAGMEIGLELQVNDANSTGERIGTLSWFDTTGTGWTTPSVYGNAMLVD